MASWASIAKAAPQPQADAQGLTSSAQGLRLLVVDANAIISGIRLEGIADRAVTIQEVHDEIRDKQSRQVLAALPYQLQLSEPTEESIRIVTRFARQTGDISSLSSNDIKLLALAHSLEVAAYGSAHLHELPAQPRMHSKHVISNQALPGWGTVSNPEEWKVVDTANEQDEAAAAAATASTSRIAQQVQQLTLNPSEPNSFLMEQQATQPPASAAAAATAGGAATLQQPQPAGSTAPAAAPAGPHQGQQQSTAGGSAATSAPADGVDGSMHADIATADDGEWEVAASSQAAARRKRKKAIKREQKQAAFEQEWEEHAKLMQQHHQRLQVQQPPQQQQQQQQDGTAAAVSNGHRANLQEQQQQQQHKEHSHCSTAAAVAVEDDDQSDSQHSGIEADSYETMDDELLAADHQIYTTDDLAPITDTSDTSSIGSQSITAAEQRAPCGPLLAPGMPGWQSSVASITADFAMQNVLLQMGLRLLTRDGRRIARLSRYALRCSACFAVTREAGRLFCPKCGNMTLDRVEVVVGADGTEYFGVKKRHILRGTKYSLPKPKGGRNSRDPVLREDVFLLKVKALGKKAARTNKAAADSGISSSVNPFAPEYNQDIWHVPSQRELAQHRGLATVLQPAWKNNPNERKLTRSNRRG